ncbi:bifunctional glycosyltransferase family 2 protein/CDP-glycerol:glycerophosphate glycerophosphotransferase [Microbacterium sp. APC 3898]|uniref:Bifunctional glycosyltransferase family 2 protein/CDP-glycerol:glycerophosphate glycerophosphotransferase n=1 Tax=Planococcus notacanthi TaxID=3035188 RepID=A0ABT7ZF77_9BACL|nr:MULTISPECIES: bifunctional glycosyltransferase family 2 protein/CDP-glycerol:glycerophosphate glycerophosphotransferase [Terrabacteria group]MDN3425800.1 bifunctional glycosyltransferase family 2 protein/CDP-glycerol:glycerophosphate glycerophosphotransferase [Planococcus sp. APC 4016]MDN3500568.1 bifunctional glycosyltransferase family 2 protein/CDP-glycerol:glycerophosphate glycerophosphotransferase [Microbacterium sp. APC 3898]
MVNDHQMTTRPKLSVVVIAFNNELYIEEALQSLQEQSYKDFEVVVVNDFSSDRTGELIDRFVEGKPNFKAIHLPENSGGCSTPRNTGIANSTGEYLMFLDGDDWYTVTACEKMVEAIERTDSDFVAGQVIRTNNYEIWYHKQLYSTERINLNIREFMGMLFDSLSVNKIYKRSFLDAHHLRFPEGIHYEDIVFTGKAYFLAESFSIIPEPVYYWRVVENSDVKSITNRRFEFENFENRIVAHRYFDQFLRESGAMLYQKEKNNKFLRHDLKLYTNDYLLFDEEYKDKFHALIYDYLHETMDEYAFLNLAEKDRILYYLLYIGDRAGFDDYIAYINGVATAANRIYAIGSQYYFKASKGVRNHEKFLKLQQPEIAYRISDIQFDEERFSFHAMVNVNSIDSDEITSFWVLRNRQTGATLVSEKSDEGTITFHVKNMAEGNYYLSLVVNHMGNLHRVLVKKSEIADLPNIEVRKGDLSKSIYINQKNSFSIRVQPVKGVDQVKWKLKQRRTAQSAKKSGNAESAFQKWAKRWIPRLPVRSNWVLFESHMGKQYSDSPKYLYEELLESGRKYKYIWSFQDPETVEVPGPAVKVKRNSLKHLYYLNRAKFWVDNQGLAHLADKKEEQVYIQTWHGTPLKRMGYDQKKLPSNEELARLKKQTDAWDYLVSPNRYTSKVLKRGFRYGGEILETGYPRNDLLIRRPPEIKEKARMQLGIPSGKQIILFAPTFRDWDPNSFQRVLDDVQYLSKEVDDNTVFVLRLHYLLSDKISQFELPPNIVDASNYQDIQELYLLSDMLITDYSSVMFDYALLKRPILLYCYDLDEYVTRRGMYFEFAEKAPGPVCETIEELIEYINQPEKLAGYEDSLERFVEEFGSLEDGKASAKVIETVFGRK